MTAVAGADEKNPTHHVTLADVSTTVGLMLTRFDGTDNPLAIARSSYPRTSTKISSGEGSYDDFEPPYKPISGSDTSGGRGADLYESDKTRFYDSGGVWTSTPNQVILGGAMVFADGDVPKKQVHFWNETGTYSWTTLTGSARFFAAALTITTAGNYHKLEVVARKVGSPGTLTGALYSYVGTVPVASQRDDSIAGDFYTNIAEIGTAGFATIALGAATYSVVVSAEATDDASNHWEILTQTNPTLDGAISATGLAGFWTNVTYAPVCRLSEEITDEHGIFFEYKRALYYVTNKTGKIYRNGYRGAADAGAVTVVEDGTNPFPTTAGALTNSIVELIEGTGSDERQNWRDVSNSDQNTLTVSAWDSALDTSTSYVVKKTNYWSLVATLSHPVTDVCVAGELVIFAHGDTVAPSYYMEHNKAGVWTVETAAHSSLPGCSRLESIWHPVDGSVVYASRNDHPIYGSVVYKCLAPPRFGDLYKKLGTLVPINQLWAYSPIANIAQTMTDNGIKFTLNSSYTSGSIEVMIELEQPVDLLAAQNIYGTIKPSTNLSSGQLKLLVSDRPIGRKLLPSQVLAGTPWVAPDEIWWRDDNGAAASAFYSFPQGARNMPTTWRGKWATITLATADNIYIGSTSRFNNVKVDISVANNNAATMAASYFNGATWTALTVTDTTESPAGTTLAVDGSLSWTMPLDWQQGYVHASPDATNVQLDTSLFWVKVNPSALLDAVTFTFEVSYISDFRESYRYTPSTLIKDGEFTTYETNYRLDTDSFLYIGHSDVFNEAIFDFNTLNASVAATITAEYFNGWDWVSVTITDGTKTGGFPFGVDGTISFTIPKDWATVSLAGEDDNYYIRLKTDASLPVVNIYEITVRQAEYDSFDMPASTANVWSWFKLSLPVDVARNPDYSQIKYLTWTSTTNNFNFTIQDIFYGRDPGVDDEDVIKTGPDGGRILRLAAYGEERKNCWVIKEREFGEIQAENEDLYVPVPLEELSTLSSISNGLGVCTNDTYLYWTMDAMRVERFYNRQLEDIGPDADEGLPPERQGTIRQLLSLAGAVYAGIDGGSLNTSSILARSGSGWHEIFRLPKYDEFSNMFLQVIPGNNVSRLWIASSDFDLRWIHVSKTTKNPYRFVSAWSNEEDFHYRPNGYLVTPWISAGFLDVSKLAAYMSLYTENLAAGDHTINVDYQLETGTLTSGWTNINEFDTSPWEKAPSTPLGVSGRRVRLRFRLDTDDSATTPLLKAWVLDLLMRFPVKYSYSFQVRVRDYDKDLRGVADNTLRAETVMTQLDTWATSQTMLTFRNPYSIFDNKTVVIEPSGVRPITISMEDGVEVHIAEITVLEI